MRATLLIFVFLSGCGLADVGSSAATAGKVQAEQARQGKETLDKVQRDLDAANRQRAGREEAAARKE